MEPDEIQQFLPCRPIYDILLRSQGEHGKGCVDLDACAACFGVRKDELWDPEHGRIPRSFAGALRSVYEVRLVIVQGEPSNPKPRNGQVEERFSVTASGRERLELAAWRSFAKLTDPDHNAGIEYHRNLARFVVDCFRGEGGRVKELHELLARTFITASVLCGIPGRATDTVANDVAIRCAKSYLLRQLAVFTRRKPVLVAMGRKAADRLRMLGITGFIETWHPGKPAAIRKHRQGEDIPCLTCNLAKAAERVRSQLPSREGWIVRPRSIADRVFEAESAI